MKKIPFFIFAAVVLLFLLSCSQWKLIKESGIQPPEKTSENTYIIKKEFYNDLSPDSRKAEFKKYKNEYIRVLIYEKKAEPGQEKLIEQCTTEKYYDADYKNQWGETPKGKILLCAEFVFDRKSFNKMVLKDKFTKDGIKITGTGQARLETLMKN